MESPSGALNENTNGSSQLSAGRAGRWREVEKCGFLVPSLKRVPKMAIFSITFSWCKIEPFCPGDIFMYFGTLYPAEEELGQTDTRSSSYEQFIDFFGGARSHGIASLKG